MPSPNVFAATIPVDTSSDDGSAARRRRNELLARALMKQGGDTSMPFTSGAVGGLKLASGLMGGVLSGLEDRRLADAEAAGAAALTGIPAALAARNAPAVTGAPASTPSVPSFAGGKTAMVMPNDPATETRFLGTLKGNGLTNPYGLAAAGAYANAESGYSAKNITGSWSDPSQSGQPGTSGGILSWRGPRLEAMRSFTAGAADPVEAQARFFLAENPALTSALQNAKSTEEAHSLMANAWKFAGYNQPGGEAQRRLDMTRAYLGRVGGDRQAQANPADLPAPNASPVGFDPMGNYRPDAEPSPGGFTIPPAPASTTSAASNLGLPAPDLPGPVAGLGSAVSAAIGGQGSPDLSGGSWADEDTMPSVVMSEPKPDPLGAPGMTSMGMIPREGGGWVPAPPPRDGLLPTMPMPTAAESGPVSPPQPPSSATEGPALPPPGPVYPRSETGLSTAMDAPPPLPPPRPAFADMPAPGAMQTALPPDPARAALVQALMAPRQPDMTSAENAGVNDFTRSEADPGARAALARQLMGGRDAPPVEPRQRMMAQALAPGLAAANDGPGPLGTSRPTTPGGFGAGPSTAEQFARVGLDPRTTMYGGDAPATTGSTGGPAQILPPAQQQATAPAPQGGGLQGFLDRVFGGGAPAQPAANAGPANPMAQINALANSPNPVHQLAARQMVQQLFQRPEYGFVMGPDGTMIRTDKHGGTAAPVYNAPKPPAWGIIGKNALGDEQYGWINPKAQTVTPVQTPGATGPIRPGMPGSTIPAPPPGVDPKTWSKEQSEEATRNALPAPAAQVSALRQEVIGLPSYKNMAQAAPVYRSMFDAAGRDSKAADLNMIYGLGKIMDPGSVVREGEMALANGTSGLDERLKGFANSIFGGARLTPETRAALMAEAHGRMQSYENMFDRDSGHYRGIATRNRMPVDDVVPPLDRASPWTPAAPAPAAGANPAAPAGSPARPQSQADFDRIPRGGTYVDPDDGKTYRKR